MTPERWHQIDNLFQAVIELEPAERELFLDSSCAGDEELRREVESLISSDDEGVSFIDGPAFEAAATLLADSQPVLNEGQHFANYEVIRLLGRGGMGEVYLAEDKKLKRKVALKLLPADYTTDKERLRRFQQEAQAASALNHPNILTIHELGDVNDRQFIATEFVDGETLRERLTRGPISLSEALEISIEVVSALAAAHRAGIIHRDIKPENIMLRTDGYVKVLDFGLAKLVEELVAAPDSLYEHDIAQSSSLVMGTIKYMSPEQARGGRVDQRSDIFSFGIVLFEMVTGRAPFSGKTASEQINSILNDEPTLPDDVADDVQLVIRKCLSKDKTERYESAQALVTDLKTVRKELEPETTREQHVATAGTGERPLRITAATTASSVEYSDARRPAGRPIFILATLAVIAAGISFGAYLFVKSRRAAMPFQKIAITKFTNFGDAWAPSISPDGKYVVYAKNNVGPVKDRAQFTLWLKAVGTANEVQILPPTFGRVYSTAFSPDGQRVYYGVGAGEPIRIFVIPAAGGNPTELPLKRAFPLGVSPDGNQLAYLDSNPTEGKTSVMIANADGTNEREIVTRPEANYFRRTVRPSWSPDGKLIACIGQDRGKSFPHVFVVDVEERTEKKITSQKWTDIRGVAWLPEMDALLLVAAEETSSIPQIWHISYPGGEARRVTNDAVNYSRLDLTTNGDTVATTTGEILTSIWVMPVENGQANSNAPISVDVSKARQINSVTLTSRDDLNNAYERLSWTTDGRIVYMSKESGNADIWSMSSVGSDRKQLTTDPHSDSDSVTSPDGRYIAFVSNRTGAENIWIMDSNGENQRQLTSQFIERSPSFSADSNWVYFNSWETGKATVWKVSVDGGQPLSVIPYTSFFPSISPDGSLLAYIGDQQPSSGMEEVFVAPSQGGSPIKSFEGNYVLNWTPTGTGLSYPWQGPIEGQPNRQTFNLWEQLLTGGKPRQLTKFAEPIFVHAWSRDGKTLAVLTAKYTSDVVLISDVK